MRKITSALSILFLLGCVYGAAGCAHVDKAPLPAAAPAAAPTCIGVKVWSPAEEQQLAKATAAFPPDSIVIAALADYGRMRKAARAVCPAS